MDPRGPLDAHGDDLGGYAGVDLFERRVIGVDEHQSTPAFVGELQSTPTQAIHTRGGHHDGHVTVAADRRVFGGEVELGEVQVVGVTRATRTGHFDPQRQGVARRFGVHRVDHDVSRFVGQGEYIKGVDRGHAQSVEVPCDLHGAQ